MMWLVHYEVMTYVFATNKALHKNILCRYFNHREKKVGMHQGAWLFMCSIPRLSAKLEAKLIESKSKSSTIKIIMENDSAGQWDVGAIVVECYHGERWQEVESHDERLIVTIPRIPTDRHCSNSMMTTT
jgi:hypothetical protein